MSYLNRLGATFFASDSPFKKLRLTANLALLAALMLTLMSSANAQQTFGNVRGVVKDPNGAVVTGAKVSITNKKTNNTVTTQSTGEGEYQFNNLPVGDYVINVEANTFKAQTINDVRVQLNQTTDVPTNLTIGATGETIEVSAAGAELVDTTTTNLAKSFTERQAVDLAQTSAGGVGASGVNNLALLAPNVSSSGGVGVGTGGSVGGQRPRNNNFIVDGIDNNDKSVTGPQVYVSPETVSEFTLLSNQYSAEFARSTGGQFITVTKSGTNAYHGTAYGFFQNRHLNALDTQLKLAGTTREDNPRNDFGRIGGNVGGPILKDKLFFFGSYERQQSNFGQGALFVAPTAAGFAQINSIPGLSATNLGVFKQFVPVASAADATPIIITCPNGATPGCIQFRRGAADTAFTASVATGNISVPAPAWTNQDNFVLNLDYTQDAKTQHRGRFLSNRIVGIDSSPTLPVFFGLLPAQFYLFSYTMTHAFSDRSTNELRLAYRRRDTDTPATEPSFPGLDRFPNIGLGDLGVNIGPNPVAPQFTIENNYQIVDNFSYLRGNHSMKFGGDIRFITSPSNFLQRSRGDYEYNFTDTFLHDLSGDANQRSIGSGYYPGNEKLLFLFAQDDFRFRTNLTLNLGLNYSLQQVPTGAKLQTLNAIATVPGLLDFREPKAQKTNFGPRVGLAYSPQWDSGWLGKIFGGKDQSSIRAGFSMAYDVLFDNLFTLAQPPQKNVTINQGPGIVDYLKNGGILPTFVPPTTAAAARVDRPDRDLRRHTGRLTRPAFSGMRASARFHSRHDLAAVGQKEPQRGP